MPGLTRQPSVRSKSSKLEAASKKADEAIRILRQTAPNEDFTEILVSHWEELKMRYERLKKARAQKAVDKSESAKEEEEKKPTVNVHLEQQEDGTFKFILPSQTGEGKPEAYILDSILFKKDDPAYNIVITADEIIRFSAASIVKHWDKLEVMESQMPFLDSIMDTLIAQKTKIDDLWERQASLVAKEIAAQLYLDDALRYILCTHIILNSVGCELVDDLEYYTVHDDEKSKTPGKVNLETDDEETNALIPLFSLTRIQ